MKLKVKLVVQIVHKDYVIGPSYEDDSVFIKAYFCPQHNIKQGEHIEVEGVMFKTTIDTNPYKLIFSLVDCKEVK